MDSVEIEIKLLYISERITMRSCLLQPLQELFKILQLKSKNSLEVLKKIRMLKNINQTGHTIKMMSPVLTLQAEIIEILLSQENVVRCLQSTYGIPTQCNQSLISILEQVPKVQLLYLSVHVKDMLLLLTRVMITPCIFIMFKEKRCFFPSQQGLTLSLIFSGLKNQTISNFVLSLQDHSNSGTQLMLVKNYTKMVHSDQNSLKLDLTALFSTRMVSVIQVVLMVVFMFGIKSKTLVQFSKLTLVKLPLQHVLKEFSYLQVKMICYLFSHVIRVNINS